MAAVGLGRTGRRRAGAQLRRRQAATLTAAGLLLVGLRDRLDRVRIAGRLRRPAARLAAATPVLTALLVLAVGVGLAVRSLTGAG